MATFTLTRPDLFAEGAEVKAYTRPTFPGGELGSAVDTQTVSSGAVTFTGLADGTAYVAVGTVSGRRVNFTTTPAVAGSGGGVATAQGQLLDAPNGPGVSVGASGTSTPTLALVGSPDFSNSTNIADFITVSGSVAFAADCMIFGKLEVFLDNAVATQASGEVVVEEVSIGSVDVPVGEIGAAGTVFVYRVSEGDLLSVNLANGDGSGNVFYPVLKLWLIG